jgi:hypothetical protein
VLLKAGKSEAALALFRANTAAFEGRATHVLELAMSYELMARAAHESKDHRSAVTYQRKAIAELERIGVSVYPAGHVFQRSFYPASHDYHRSRPASRTLSRPSTISQRTPKTLCRR